MSADPNGCFLGIDLGTTNAKVVLIDSAARVIGTASREYPVEYPKPGWAEQDPEIWWNAVRDLVREVVERCGSATQILALGVSGQMHGLVALDRDHAVIRPAILWNDQRAQTQCRAIIDTCGGLEGLLRYTNNGMLAGYTAPKILWLRENEPQSFARIQHVLLPKDYLRFRLTGDLVTDVSDASGTGLFDVPRRTWSTELLGLLKLPRDWFPSAYESTEVVGSLRTELAARLGLPNALPVIGGGGDAALQPLGSGVLDDSQGLLVVGTGGNVTVPLAASVRNDGARLQVFCGVQPGTYVAMGATLAAGESLRWMRNLLRNGAADLGLSGAALDFATLDRLAAASEAGARRTLFFPYLQGERCPHPDADARGVFLGLSSRTTLGDLVRAIMEGVAFSMRDVLAILAAQGLRIDSFRISGGGSQSKLWRSIFASVCNAPMSTVASGTEGTAYGTALLAGISQGRWRTPGALQNLTAVENVEPPEAIAVARYQHLFGVYQQGYGRLSDLFRELAATP
jgi:xylulokinase